LLLGSDATIRFAPALFTPAAGPPIWCSERWAWMAQRSGKRFRIT